MLKKFRATAALSIAAVAGASLACSLLSSAPSIPEIATIIPSIPEIATIVPDLETPLLEDDFSDSDSGWGTGTDSDSAVEYEDGVLRMTTFREYYFTWSTPDEEDYQDVHFEVTVNNESGDSRLVFGILCNQQVVDSSFHYFAVTADGEYAIARAEVGKDDVFLTNDDDWATSDAIPADAPSYQLGADCGPGELTLYVNGQEVDSVSDSTFTEGGVGLFIWSGEEPSGAVSFDDFELTSLQ